MSRLLISVLLILSSPLIDAETRLKINEKLGIKYAVGGIGKEQLEFLNKVASRFPMQLHFKIKDSEIDIKGVDVSVFNTKGDLVFKQKVDGPHLFLGVENGRYTVVADYGSQKLSYTRDLVGRRFLLMRFQFLPGN